MNNLTESYIRRIIRKVISESILNEVSSEEKTKIMAKSNERVPFSSELMKQAILQGREIGINYRSKNDKYEMPVTKSRIIHPVAMGTDKNGNIVIRGLHITGQSEKAARETGNRSAEVEAEKDGMNAWRLFKTDNLKSMWFTDRFFSDSIPGFNPNDKGMSSIQVSYDPRIAKQYQDELVAGQAGNAINPEEIPQQKVIQQPGVSAKKQAIEPNISNPSNKDVEQLGYQPNNGVKSFFK